MRGAGAGCARTEVGGTSAAGVGLRRLEALPVVAMTPGECATCCVSVDDAIV